MLIPKHIRKEDKIAIVCTARFVEEHQLEYSIKLLKSWGLQVVLGSTIGKQNHQFGGTDQDRAEDLQRQLDDLDIKAIWWLKVVMVQQEFWIVLILNHYCVIQNG